MSLRFRIGPFTFGKSGIRLSIWRGRTGFSTPITNRKSSSFGNVKFGIFSYFFSCKSKHKSIKKPNFEKMIFDDHNLEKTELQDYVQKARKDHEQAYAIWSTEDDEKLIMLFRQGATIKELSEIFDRTRGAIRARIEKIY